MSDQDAVLFANEAFYAAFESRSVEDMGRVWSENKPVSCTHPGWQTLYGRQDVMESWNAILSNPESPNIECRAQRVIIYGEIAIVTCVEEIASGDQEPEFLSATNVFVRTGSVWTMVHHHAGPVHLEADLLDEDEYPPPPIN